ncbi:MAG: asparagine synthase (glutamine-hydrolyzing) [Chitinophagaceae bacterium]|nr:MAG: asparagine synthase (glutamine-hydrolyzing) [Chitinophagaceae bacterium]
MCGFAGVLSADQSVVRDVPLHQAIACLRHRGPEPAAFWTDATAQCRFAHGRLSIIDPDLRARQPFTYNDRITIAYNGELYNYVELREELRQSGFAFDTKSDTEVLCAAWMAWGPACLDRFDGAFAFALWDAQEARMYAARDRFGEKPFYYHFDGNAFYFASELKALWTMGVQRKANDAMAYNFLTLGYTTNPFAPDETFYDNVFQLQAGKYLCISPDFAHRAFGDFGSIFIEERAWQDADAISEFRRLLGSSVRRRLRSDVAVGTSLSGGLDSATVAALCRREHSSTFTHKAFTAVFPGFEKDERALSELLASRLDLDQHIVEIRDDEVAALMDAVQAQQDEPVASASALAQWAVFAAAKRAGVTVLLDGQGADETLAGYEKYYRWYWQQLSGAGKLGSSGELEAARALGITKPFGMFSRAAARMPHFGAALLEQRRKKQAARTPFLHPSFVERNRLHLNYMLPPQLTLNGVLHYNTFTNGLEELLRLADRNSMAHSLEVRLPFLSPELVQFLFTLPANFKIREGRTKWILRKAMEGIVPDEVLWQPRKTGFEPPQARWMALPDVQERIAEGRRKLVDAGVLDASVLQQKIQPHTAYAAAAPDWKYWALSVLY